MTSLRRYYARIAAFPTSHPARKLLDELSQCQAECVGREIPWKGREHEAVDQEWLSAADGYRWSFSHFAYKYVVYYPERVLDAWVTELQDPSKHEIGMVRELPHAHTLLDECLQAAKTDANQEILRLVGLTRSLFETMEAAVLERWRSIDYSPS